MLNCQVLTTYLQKVKADKNRLDNFIETRNIEQAKRLQSELQSTIKKLRITIGLKDLDLLPDQIALSQIEISVTTKLYNGPLFPGIFQNYPNLEHFYTNYPEGEITASELEIGGDTADELQTKLEVTNENGTKKFHIDGYARDMLTKMYASDEFKHFVQNPEQIKIIRLKVSDLGFTSSPTIRQVYQKAHEFGLELCPAEVAPYQLLKDLDLQNWYYYRIGMEQINNWDDYPAVFHLECDYNKLLWLGFNDAFPTDRCNLVWDIMFCLRSSASSTIPAQSEVTQ